MTTPVAPMSEHAVMANMGITEEDIERRKQLVGIVADDLQHLAVVRDAIVRHVDELVQAFFQFLTPFEGARVLLGYRELYEQARGLKRDHILAMAQGKYDVAYIEQRVRLALLYGRAGLEVKLFLGAFQNLIASIGRVIERELPDRQRAFEGFLSLHKVGFLDIGVFIDVLVFERERTIRRQSEAIRELSTPVLQIRDRLLLLPLIGVIDTHRAQLITQSLLDGIRKNRAKVIVVDVTGVATIDSRVAGHLVQTVTAARLMGARVLVTGVSAEVAQSLVTLGIDLAPFTTVGDLQGGLEDAERLLGLRVVRDDARTRTPGA